MGRSYAGRHCSCNEIGVSIMVKKDKLKGTAIKKLEDTFTVERRGTARYAWAAGQALSRFLHELKNGKLIGRLCHKCRRILIPPRMYCEHCFRSTDEWVYVEPIGRVNTAVVSYIATTRDKLDKPLIVAVIEIEGTGGSGLFHYLEDVNPEDVINRKVFGMRVRAVWKPEEERQGSITDIKYFVPFEGGEE